MALARAIDGWSFDRFWANRLRISCDLLKLELHRLDEHYCAGHNSRYSERKTKPSSTLAILHTNQGEIDR